MSRIDKLRELLDSGSLDAVLISSAVNRYYASGFTGTAGTVLISKEEAFFITDFRYAQQAAAQCCGYHIVILKQDEKLSDWMKRFNFSRIGFEADHWSVEGFEPFKENGADWIPVHRDIMNLRSIKEDSEIACIEKAAAIADSGFRHILNYVTPGMTEKEIALELEFFMRREGASSVSFETIVASGVRSSMPHGVASDKVIVSGDMITLDFGCIYQGYCSDMTRTFVVGTASDEQKRIYHLVLEAQLASLSKVKPGAICSDIDFAGRSIIDAAGYGAEFGHGTGHGVGLEIHESPRVNAVTDVVLRPGMVITIEPGIYIPEFGGVRIEDLVLVTEDGYRVLSLSPKNLMELG